MANGGRPDRENDARFRKLREQEAEFYEAVMHVLVGMPAGATVADVLASRQGQRARTKWSLKHGRRPPL
jgi:hypothetical protein